MDKDWKIKTLTDSNFVSIVKTFAVFVKSRPIASFAVKR